MNLPACSSAGHPALLYNSQRVWLAAVKLGCWHTGPAAAIGGITVTGSLCTITSFPSTLNPSIVSFIQSALVTQFSLQPPPKHTNTHTPMCLTALRCICIKSPDDHRRNLHLSINHVFMIQEMLNWVINCPVRQTDAAVERPWHCGLLKLFRDQSTPHLQTRAVGCYITSFISQPDEDVFTEDFAQVALSSENLYY